MGMKQRGSKYQREKENECPVRHPMIVQVICCKTGDTAEDEPFV